MLKKLFAPVDMTQGKPWKCILFFTLPMILGNIAQQLYNTVDSIVVSRYIKDAPEVLAAAVNNPNFVKAGDRALSAVGSCGPILNMLLVLFIGISAGASIMVAQYFGAKKREELSYTVGNCITVTAISCALLIAVMTPLIRPLLVLLNTPASTLEWCVDYLTISLVGIAGMAYYNILSGIIRGLGDSVSALLYLLVATALNIVLDIYFVAGLNMEVAGVALATVLAQCVSSALCLWKLSRMGEFFDFKAHFLKPVGTYVRQIIRLGLPSGATQAIFSSAMIIVQSLTNSFGELFIAANVVVMRVDGFAMMPNFSFGTAMTTYAGQNVGARDYDRVIRGAKEGTFLAVGISAAITGIILLFGKPLMSIFTETPELVDMSYHLMCILAFGYIAMAVTQSLSGVMRGAGDTVTPMLTSLITSVCLRIPIAYGLAPFMGQNCIQVSLLCTWVMGAVITTIFYSRGKWKTKAI